MNLKCLLRGHRASADEVYNCGYYFSRCARCGHDMMRAGRAWQAVPRGHRVVWKAGPSCHSMEPDFTGHLPVLHRDANLPAAPTRGMSWSRALVATGGSSAPARCADEGEMEAAPNIVFLVALNAGLRLLFALRPR